MAKEKKENLTRNDGSYALDTENNKMSVTTSTGQHSILFEDIASTSYSTVTGKPEWKMKNKKALIIGIIAIVLGGMLGEEGAISGFLVLGGAIALYFGFGREEKTWDNVTVETRGGKTVTYSVDLGQGKVDMDAIEEARRS
tara:strand:+ start:409 stop:831 length:423 start_codon:yes stop_codon:yes gene_type:complete